MSQQCIDVMKTSERVLSIIPYRNIGQTTTYSPMTITSIRKRLKTAKNFDLFHQVFFFDFKLFISSLCFDVKMLNIFIMWTFLISNCSYLFMFWHQNVDLFHNVLLFWFNIILILWYHWVQFAFYSCLFLLEFYYSVSVLNTFFIESSSLEIWWSHNHFLTTGGRNNPAVKAPKMNHIKIHKEIKGQSSIIEGCLRKQFVLPYSFIIT